ncbi:unnamed protein product [Rhizophagus irregularis]|nr:unnamed protein product [Rhizophagus irregularis]
MKNYYEGSNEGGWISLKELPTPSTDIKTCPELYHGFDENTEQVWIDHVRKLLKRYDELTFIIRATKFPPHKKALEASITNLNANNADLEEQLITQLSDLHIGGSSSNSNSNSNSTPPEYLQFTSQVDRTEELSEMKKIDQITRLKLNKSGHWYECSKGHPYIIEEFNEATGCPDCNMFVIN